MVQNDLVSGIRVVNPGCSGCLPGLRVLVYCSINKKLVLWPSGVFSNAFLNCGYILTNAPTQLGSYNVDRSCHVWERQVIGQ